MKLSIKYMMIIIGMHSLITAMNQDKEPHGSPRTKEAYDATSMRNHENTYLAASSLINRIYSIADDSEITTNKDRIKLVKKDCLSPEQNQTEQGIFLEIFKNGAASLWTPWGKWTFIASMHIFGHGDRNFWNLILQNPEIAAEFYKTKYFATTTEPISIIYKIVKLNQNALPIAQERLEYVIDYKSLQDQWNSLKKNCLLEKRKSINRRYDQENY